MSPVAKRIREALTEFSEALKSGEPLETRMVVRRVEATPLSNGTAARTVKKTRRALQASQTEFATFLGVSLKTLKAWEAGEQPNLQRLGPNGAGQGRKLPPLRITDVRTILTQPAGIRLVVVKVTTNEAGLYGLGCATFTQRARVVETAIDRYLKPFLIGKDPKRIEDVFQSSFVSSYWRNGPVLGNALSGVDMALWDILGKRTRLPVYQLLGGKCREAVDTYRHASGKT